MLQKPVLYIVIPCYNEQEVLPLTAPMFREEIQRLADAGKIDPESRILFVNDGSRDNTWQIIQELSGGDPHFQGLCLSRNRGHQNALLAGLMYAKDRCDLSISMDADLQDDINAADEMIGQYEQGCDIVYGVRSSRDTDTPFKRKTALLFYKMMNRMGVELVSDSADFRLMSRRALAGLAEFREVNLFLRGLIPMIGYRSGKVYYERAERFAGESKYPLGKMLNFSIEGITSLSIAPIRIITNAGVAVFIISIVLLLWGIIQKLRGVTVPGWSSLIVSIWAIGGLILLSIGVVGEYVGKIYLEAKGRPRFLIDEILETGENADTRDAKQSLREL